MADPTTSYFGYGGYNEYYYAGLDCSGFAAWVLYNTLYTRSGGSWLVYQSTEVASKYNSKGWVSLSTNNGNASFKPGDVVSMNGHVWISLGECSDGSVLLVHIMLFSEGFHPFIFINFRKERVCLFWRVVNVGQTQTICLWQCLAIDRCAPNDIDLSLA